MINCLFEIALRLMARVSSLWIFSGSQRCQQRTHAKFQRKFFVTKISQPPGSVQSSLCASGIYILPQPLCGVLGSLVSCQQSCPVLTRALNASGVRYVFVRLEIVVVIFTFFVVWVKIRKRFVRKPPSPSCASSRGTSPSTGPGPSSVVDRPCRTTINNSAIL